MSGIISRVNNDIIETYQGQDPQGDVGDSGVLSALAEIATLVLPSMPTSTIQSLITNNRNVRFVGGSYLLSGINVPSNTKIEFDSNITITSDGLNDHVFTIIGNYVMLKGNQTLINLNNGSTFFINCYGTSSNNYTNIQISGFEVYNFTNTIQAHMASIYFGQSQHIKISDIYVHDYGTASGQNTSTTLVYAFYSEYCNDVDYKNISTNNVLVSYCGTSNSNVRFTDFTFTNGIANVIYILPGNTDFKFQNGTISGGSQGLTLYGDNFKVTNVSISNCTLCGIFIRQMTNLLVSKVYFYNNYYDVQDQDVTQSSFVKISDCISNGVMSTSANYVYLQNANNYDITNWTFNNIQNNQVCFLLYGVNNGRLKYLNISNCFFNGVDASLTSVTTTGINIRVSATDAIQFCKFVNNTFYNLYRGINSYITGGTGGVNNHFTKNNYPGCTYRLNAINANNIIQETSNRGSATLSGNGSATSFTIAHGLTGIPTFFSVQPANSATGTAGINYVTADATNLTVNFKTAPASGSNNLVLAWRAEI